MSTQTIYAALREAGLTAEGACGLLGNMQAESGMISNIAQRGATKLTDRQYTAAADTGEINFANDAVGYGLCQWTHFSRKKDLLTFARSRGASVGNEDMQVQFCIRELREGYPNVWTALAASHDLYECVRIVCIQYERPAINNVETRYQFARQFLEDLAAGEPLEEAQVFAPDLSVMMLQTILCGNGYNVPITGFKSAEFFTKLREFTDDMEGC